MIGHLVVDEVEASRVLHEVIGWVLVFDEPADPTRVDNAATGDFIVLDSQPQVSIVTALEDYLLIDAPAPEPKVLDGDTLQDIILIQGGGPPGPQGPPGASGARYDHIQATPAAEWTVQHDLGFYPTVVLFLDDAPDECVYTDVSHADTGLLYLSFPSPESGRAYLS